MKIALVMTVLACAAGCGLGSVEVTVNPDGSGKVEIARTDTDMSSGAPPAGVAGVSRVDQLRFGLLSEEYAFADIRKLAIGGLRFKWTRGPRSAVTLVLTVDTKPTTFWFQRLGITAERVQHNRAGLHAFLKKVAREPDSQMMLSMFGGADAESAAGQVLVKVKLQGTGKTQRLQVQKPAQLPPGWTLGKDGQQGAASLTIPAEAILAGHAPPVTLVATATLAPATQPAPPPPAP
ncbi:MAG TPA: hypothetical protein VGQ83_05935 [Polyangia bacterium]|jgi:hypothetical protein